MELTTRFANLFQAFFLLSCANNCFINGLQMNGFLYNDTNHFYTNYYVDTIPKA